MPVSLVTPSTRPATSSPKASRTSSSDRRRVLDRVVQERGAQRLGVEPHPRADLRDADRMDDEVLARLAALVGVVLAGEHERVDHAGGGRPGARPRRRAPRRSRTGRRAARARSAVRSAGASARRVVLVVLAVDGLVRVDRHVRPPSGGGTVSSVVCSCWSAMRFACSKRSSGGGGRPVAATPSTGVLSRRRPAPARPGRRLHLGRPSDGVVAGPATRRRSRRAGLRPVGQDGGARSWRARTSRVTPDGAAGRGRGPAGAPGAAAGAGAPRCASPASRRAAYARKAGERSSAVRSATARDVTASGSSPSMHDELELGEHAQEPARVGAGPRLPAGAARARRPAPRRRPRDRAAPRRRARPASRRRGARGRPRRAARAGRAPT